MTPSSLAFGLMVAGYAAGGGGSVMASTGRAARALYGWAYTAGHEGQGGVAFLGLMFNLFLLSMSVVACAGNVFTFVAAWEAMSVTSYFLVMTDADREESRRAGLWSIALTP